jgi:hypothetical protein
MIRLVLIAITLANATSKHAPLHCYVRTIHLTRCWEIANMLMGHVAQCVPFIVHLHICH